MNTFMTFFFTIFTLIVAALGAPVDSRDVFVPPLLAPTAGTVWRVGKTLEVKWDVSSPPKQITNRNGRIILSQNSRLLNLDHPLAQGFDIMVGKLNVTLPKDTKPGKDYQLVLMGDSGNAGPRFSIVA